MTGFGYKTTTSRIFKVKRVFKDSNILGIKLIFPKQRFYSIWKFKDFFDNFFLNEKKRKHHRDFFYFIILSQSNFFKY